MEFALGSGILMAAFAGTFEFGYSFYVYNNLEMAVNNGAKFAALKTYTSSTVTPDPCFTTAVQNMVAYGDPTGTTTVPVTPGLSPSNVVVTVTFANGVPSTMAVAVTGYTIQAGVAKISLTNKPHIVYPYLGRYVGGTGETCVQ